MPKKDIWRQPSPTTLTAVGCQPIVLSTGTIVINATKTVILNDTYQATYAPYCPDGFLPLRIFKSPSLLEMGEYNINVTTNGTNITTILPLPFPLPFPDWQSPFYASTIPACVAIGASATLTWALSLALLCSPRRPLLMKILVLISSVCITILSAVFMTDLRHQYNNGYVDGYLIVDALDNSDLEAAAILISKFALLLAELITLMRLFPRKREMRLIFYMGFLIICLDRILWGISEFSPAAVDERTDSADAVVVFAYLFSIATAIIYAGAILLYSWWKWRVAYRPNLILLAFMSHIATFLPIILFILDLADQYLDSWSTYAKLVSILCASVCVWVWVDRIEDYERTIELRSVLGRQQYTEDHGPFYLGGPSAGGGGGGIGLKRTDNMKKKGNDKKDNDTTFNKILYKKQRSGSHTVSDNNNSSTTDLNYNANTTPNTIAVVNEDKSVNTNQNNDNKYLVWNRRLMELLKFNYFNRPATSSSMQTTYVVSSTDQLGMTGETDGNIVPLTTFSSSLEERVTVHKHPFRGRSQP